MIAKNRTQAISVKAKYMLNTDSISTVTYLNIKLAKYSFDNLPCKEAILFGAPRKNVVPFHKRAGWNIEKPKTLFTCDLNKIYQFVTFIPKFRI